MAADDVTRHGHTHRLDLADPDVRDFTATVVAVDPERGIVLDRSAFYPGGGGQPPDEGVLLWGGVRTRIVGTVRGDDLYLVPAEGDPVPAAGTAVRGAIDDERRTGLMRTHSGLHVLTAVVFRDFGAKVTGGNMEPLTARMDFDLPQVPPDFKDRVAEAVNAEIALDRPIAARLLPRAEAFAIPNLVRTAADLLPEDLETIRVVDIDGLDQQADGGTHVASTKLIGRVEVVKVENKGRGFRRLRVRVL
ncbi:MULTISPECIES: alanyl-tRNA editing protein [Pseudonocardia]|uniref:alanyl-tRNA editing protein n=1 Tax=Pseudonocardia TaxID=1847 RepID=UPI000CCFF8A4|nr:alanyl-tRNA editing protein [Pseudonocardia dioxanivorans]GJF06020.1 Ala-tRNA(Pro) hydrolase [Pseudonocardia sp. D17]